MDKFVSFDEAIEKLGISAERLNKLREDGELRAYRDGTSWKFRRDEIERFATEGLPEEAPPSDISLASSDDLMSADELPDLEEITADPDELKLADELSLGSDIDLSGSGMSLDLDDDAEPEASALDLSAEDTVTTGPSASDSILLSEEELGESVAAPASTIIGKDELDADLDLALDDGGSDVKLAPAAGSGESHVLSSGIAGSGVLDELEKESGATSAFADLEELELDLSAESSRILSPEEAKEVKEAAAAAKPAPAKKAAESDLQLEDLGLDDDEGTDPVPAEMEAKSAKEPAKAVGDSDIDLASDDDFVLAEAGGSDITLDSADSGINLISPSDSGLALDDIPLDVGGSAILSSLSLDVDDDISLIPSAPAKGKAKIQQQDEPLAELQADDDFNLTPMAALEDDGDSSSQVIALDADMEGLGAESEEAAFGFEEVEPGEEMGDEFSEAGLAVAGYGAPAVAARTESEYGVGQILALGSTGLLLMLCTLVLTDMIRNIWGWQENLSLTSSLLDGVLGMLGMRTQ